MLVVGDFHQLPSIHAMPAYASFLDAVQKFILQKIYGEFLV